MATIFRAPLISTARGARPLPNYADPPNLVLFILGQDQFFGEAGQPPLNWDWTIPRVLRPTPPFSYIRPIGLDVINPFPNYDFPSPRRALQPVDRLTWLHSVNLGLINQDQFFGEPGQGPPLTDFPMPRRSRPIGHDIYLRPITLDVSPVSISDKQFLGELQQLGITPVLDSSMG